MIIIEVAGRLGADPEVRYTSSNLKVTTFRMAANLYRGGKEETVWIRVTIWGERFDKMLSYMKKGSAVIVVGDLHKPEIYTDRNGDPQISMEMTAEMLKFSPFGRGDGTEGERGGQASQGQGFQQGAAAVAGARQPFEVPVEEPAAVQPAGGEAVEISDEDKLPF